jgi:hypothetical protein
VRTIFKIEDERHAEIQEGDYVSLAAVAAELRRLAQLPWDQAPNAAPCANWRNCGRTYELIEYDVSTAPWRELRRVPALEVHAKGVRWVSAELAELGLQ